MRLVMAPPAPLVAAPPDRRVQRRWATGDVIAVIVLAVIPILAYAIPAMLGHPVLTSDDATQNFPMRVLVGQELRSGHLPLLAMPISSGTFLLAGWNAGAAYPFTWLFAVLPAAVAWTFNLMLTSWMAAIGLFIFMRANRLRPFPAALGAVTFAFAGAMDAQVVHFGLVAGVSWIPLQLLGVLRLSEATNARTRARWCAVLAAASAMTLLAGEPRAIDVAALVTGPYVLWRIARAEDSRPTLAIWITGAAMIAIALGAVQLLPGLHAINDSQRAASSFDLYDSGSYPLSWLLLLFEPNLLGGPGSFGLPAFLGSYNLAEVTAYVGVLPWVAAFALFAQLRRQRPLPEWLLWELVAVLGIVLALGGSTPAGHLFAHIPLFGSQRLQSRNILITDLAVAVLFAYWADSWLYRREGAGARAPSFQRERILGALPAIGVAATGVVSIVWGAGMLRWLGVSRSLASLDGKLRPWFIPTVVIGLAAVLLVLFGYRLAIRRRRVLVGGLVVVDILCFTVTSLFAIDPHLGSGTSATRVSGVAAAADPAPGALTPVVDLGIPGRFATYDPSLLAGNRLSSIGSPDANLLVGGWSIQGYSAIVNGTYADGTGSHPALGAGQDVLSIPALGNGTLDQLDPGALVTVPQYLVVDANRATSLAAGGADFGPDPAAGSRLLEPGSIVRWYFGEPVDLTSVSLPVTTAGSRAVQLGIIEPAGAIRWLGSPPVGSVVPSAEHNTTPATTTPATTTPATTTSATTTMTTTTTTTTTTTPATTTMTTTVPGGVRAVGLVARSSAAGSLGAPVVSTASGVVLDVDGMLQAALTGGQWRYVRQDGPFAVFAADHPTPALVVRPLAGRSLGDATVRPLSGPELAPSSAAVTSPDGVEVVRSVAAISGWSATWQPATGGPARVLPVHRSGLVQAVDVPPGRGVLAWVYRAPGLQTGEIAGAAGLLALIGILVFGLRRRSAEAP